VGPAHERLPHFRPGFTPSHGEEIQTEFFVDAQVAVDAIETVRALGPRITGLLHVAEIRRVAADDAWISPTSARPSLGLHFTWHRREPDVRAAVELLQRELLPLGARPHWGKYFTCSPDDLAGAYPRLAEFERVRARRDPLGRFDNAFLRRVLSAVR
jgi:xylitol oxidase